MKKYNLSNMERINTLLEQWTQLRAEWNGEKESIAAECEEEGYPSRGSNYGLRVEEAFAGSYESKVDDLVRELQLLGYDTSELQPFDCF